jgi:hypothetical protein
MNLIHRLLGWLWQNLGNLALLASGLATFVVPAWAFHAANLLSEYSPFSWVAAGLVGFFVSATGYASAMWGYGKWTCSRYDSQMISKGRFVDPMQKAFEDKRIFLNEFCLPSHPLVEGKTFINCEIIGPANIVLQYGNSVQEQKPPECDAVVLDPTKPFYNALLFRNCTFRLCSFQRITFYVSADEYETTKHLAWLNWIVRTELQSFSPLETQADQSSRGQDYAPESQLA